MPHIALRMTMERALGRVPPSVAISAAAHIARPDLNPPRVSPFCRTQVPVGSAASVDGRLIMRYRGLAAR